MAAEVECLVMYFWVHYLKKYSNFACTRVFNPKPCIYIKSNQILCALPFRGLTQM